MFAEKHMKTFFWRIAPKKDFMIFVRVNLQENVAQQLFGEI